MSEVRIAAEPRTEFGKGAARRVRRADKVPVVLYGHGEDPRHFSLPGHQLMLALKHDANVLLTLETPNGDQLALPKVVVRHPVRGHLEHVDLLAVRKGEKVTVDIAVTLTGEAESGVLVDQQSTTVSVEAEATHLPEGVEVSIDGLAVGTQITAGQLTLPSGVTLAQDADTIVVQGLAAPTAEQLEAEIAESEAELGAGAVGAAELQEETVDAAGSESDAAGEGDVVPETEAPKSETPAE
ncbi:MAG: 50S ribosomal protein L25/general stress protein Ctc [Actinomycetes bacterium]